MPNTRPNQIALTLPEPLRERLDAESERTGISRSELIRALIVEALDRRDTNRSSQPSP